MSINGSSGHAVDFNSKKQVDAGQYGEIVAGLAVLVDVQKPDQLVAIAPVLLGKVFFKSLTGFDIFSGYIAHYSHPLSWLRHTNSSEKAVQAA